MKYTNKQMLEIEESAKKNSKNLVHITDKSKFSTEDKIKLGLCRHFVQFMTERKLKTKDFSKLTGIPESRISEVTNYKFEKFTVDKLLIMLGQIAEHDKKVAASLKLLSSVAEMPLVSVAVSAKLRKSVEESIHA